MDSLNQLNPQQHQAVTAGDGQILVLAGPGSGKTRVLTQRIAFLVQNKMVRPYHILAVTFTNKAARQMESRLQKQLGEDQTADLWLGTFHAICARILRRETDYLPIKANFVIMDSDDQENIVKRIIKELNINDKLFRPASVHNVISRAKNDMLSPADFNVRSYRDEVVVRVYERYNQRLLENNAVDFDDLLVMAVRLLEENPQVRERYARRFEHVLVDEFQDTNLPQYQLLKGISSWHRNLFAVGDEDQSIYRWRGADYRNVLRFEQDFPEARKFLLEQNYRSTQNVVDAARSVIDRNTLRTPKKLFSERGSGSQIVLYEAMDDHAEAAYVVDTIQQLTSRRQARASDFAVMYRTNAQSRLLEEAFMRAGVPYRLVGAQRFYGRREIKDIIAFLRLVHNPLDEISLLRVINIPPRGVGDKTIISLQLAAQEFRTSPGEILLDLGKNGPQSVYWEKFRGHGLVVLSDFGAMLAGWQEEAGQLSLPELFDRILKDILYQEFIEDTSDEALDRWSNVQELRRLAYEYEQRGLVDFLETLALVSDQDTLPEQTDVPTLLTLHAAKGLEFPRVFIIGLDEGLLPHSRSLDEPEEMAEERRLFYVGITRAKDQVYLVRAERRSTYGSYEMSIPSRFIEDIPDDLVQHQGSIRQNRRREQTWQPQSRWSTVFTPQTPITKPSRAMIQPRFPDGTHIRHATWGDGLVLENKITADGEEEIVVHFESVGIKRLIASLAKLEKID